MADCFDGHDVDADDGHGLVLARHVFCFFLCTSVSMGIFLSAVLEGYSSRVSNHVFGAILLEISVKKGRQY